MKALRPPSNFAFWYIWSSKSGHTLICTHKHMKIYIYIYIHSHTHTYIYICINSTKEKCLSFSKNMFNDLTIRTWLLISKTRLRLLVHYTSTTNTEELLKNYWSKCMKISRKLNKYFFATTYIVMSAIGLNLQFGKFGLNE